ncbi:hypothetical protein [Caryophanon latum]|uniref:hypothetical protein n=1 Tax=Caryophanon latum TaxID=33977 RepID=UPI001471A3AB|nr:hypothetical protein [Caryophanon latum]
MQNDDELYIGSNSPVDHPNNTSTSDLPIGSVTEGTEHTTDFLGLSTNSKNNNNLEKK